MIAIARKVIILDLKDYDSVTIIGIAALILSIAVAYFIVRKKIRVDLSKGRSKVKMAERQGE